ncbi:carboxypeptidase-like regulatory domain-containing protein [Mucilaginibacter sp. HMF5004]|uniref:carboxypeptidase-like regulatory domain-containing protein n=1 Tax=Mucilaginibacter rivuli TaxID=2857527 RepID=UPI001C602DBC|nr:carboxypeptidase-like regulatory domain-containing protein [Mucilaginibacter rivuli]MBW4888118.1 carboxypeptidase-like regulatory domain-containing protein [Mucilaginibacter rivuli]
MMRPLFITLLIVLPLWLSAQTLSGKVYRAEHDSSAVVANASVYYGGSMSGTLTRANGNFTIEEKPGHIPIIVSCIGYYSTTVTSYSVDQPLKVYLKPKLHQLREVRIGSDGMSRENKVWMFKREFLGTSDYALSCTITNMDDIQLDYDKKTGALTAFCDGPIKIENKKLGYHISYFLDSFLRMPKEVKFAGNFIFTEDAAAAKQKKTIRNREDAYSGSRMEFIRALWSNSLKKAHYKIYTADLRPMDADSIVCLNNKLEKVINLKYRMVIIHDNNTAYPSQMSQTITDCYIDQNGFHDTGLQWFGDMSVKRVGDMLPFEYRSVKSLSDSIHRTDSAKVAEKIKSQAIAAKSNSGNKALKDFALFKSIVLAQNTPLDARLVVKKWHTPIRYKVYGRFGADKPRNDLALAQVDSLFAQLSHLTGLSITKTDNDSEVNFCIITGELSKVKGLINPEAMDYLEKINKVGGEYYSSNENGFTSMIELIRRATLPAAQRQIMNGFGFTGIAEGYTHSLFDYNPINLPEKIQPLDAHIIQTFYNPAIKWGMTEAELDEVLLKMFEGKKVELK